MKPEINYEDFEKLDLRVVKVIEAKPHPDADKLLILKVDLGEEQRQIVAGIKASYSPEELINKQIIIVANLKPIKLRGEESRGMLLAATNSENLPILLTSDKNVQEGAMIK